MSTRRQPAFPAKRKRRSRERNKHPFLDRTIAHIVQEFTGAEEILMQHGLSCVGCGLAEEETLLQGATAHGLTLQETLVLCDDLQHRHDLGPRPITLTEAAAKALREITISSNRMDQFLRITTDDDGGFCLEYTTEKHADDERLSHASVPDIICIASSATRRFLAGATIDYQGGRFKLELVPRTTQCGKGKRCQREEA